MENEYVSYVLAVEQAAEEKGGAGSCEVHDFYKRSSCPFETVLDEWDVEDAECENELEGQSRGDGAPRDVFPVCAQEVCDEEECHYS